jgi:hypothetical protein
MSGEGGGCAHGGEGGGGSCAGKEAAAGAGVDPALGATRERGWNHNRTVGMDAIGQSGSRRGHGCAWSTLSS